MHVSESSVLFPKACIYENSPDNEYRSVMMFFFLFLSCFAFLSSLSAINPNVLVVAQDQKLHREQLKAAHETKIERDKKSREQQRQRAQDRKEKEKQRTQKKEQ